MMASFLYTNTSTHVTHDPRRLVDYSVPLSTSVPQDCLEAVGPSPAELSLKHGNCFLNQLLKTPSSSGLASCTPCFPRSHNTCGSARRVAPVCLQRSVPSPILLHRAGSSCTSASTNATALWLGKRCHAKPGISGI